MSAYSCLFEPVDIGSLRLKNRIAMAPTSMNFGNTDGSVSERNIAFYVRRALGGAGLIIVENVSPFPALKIAGQLGIWDYCHIPGLAEIAELVKLSGSRVAIQIFQPSVEKMVSTTIIPSSRLVSPALAQKDVNELSTDEIQELEDAFAEAATKAKLAGFEAVEIHGAHGHMIAAFLSRYLNRRADGYGGSIEHRTRIAKEIVEKIKSRTGADFPVLFRLNGADFVEGGNSIEDICQIAKLLQESGVDALHISAGIYRSIEWAVQPVFIQPAALAPLAERIKKSVTVPVIIAGRINSPEIAEGIIKKGQADMVSLSRPLLADPDFPKKAMTGQPSHIRPCIALCMDACMGKVISYQRGRCAVNTEVGHEGNWEISVTASPRKVLVVGGGPAGLEAARVAALRRHDVVLCESRSEIGGQLLLASRLAHKQEAKRLIDWYQRQLEELKVKVIVDTPVTDEIVRKIRPDVVVLATGVKYLRPPLPAGEDFNVVDPIELLSGAAPVGNKVAVLGGEATGCDVAIWLAKDGKRVVVVHTANELAYDADPLTRRMIVQQLESLGVETLLGCVSIEYLERGMMVRSSLSAPRLVEFDTLVIARGVASERGLADSLQSLPAEIYVIGDAKQPRRLVDAVHEGYFLGRLI